MEQPYQLDLLRVDPLRPRKIRRCHGLEPEVLPRIPTISRRTRHVLEPGIRGEDAVIQVRERAEYGQRRHLPGTVTQELSGERGFVWANGAYSFFADPGWLNTEGRTLGNPTAAHPQGLVVGFADNDGSQVLDGFTVFVYDPATSALASIPTPNSYFTIAQGLNVGGQIVGNVTYRFGAK